MEEELREALGRECYAPRIDCADVSLVYMRYLIGRGVLQAIPLSKFKYWNKTLPLFTKGEFADGRKAPQQGITPTLKLWNVESGHEHASLLIATRFCWAAKMELSRSS